MEETDSSEPNSYNWEFFDDKPPEAFIDYYETITNVSEEHRDEAMQRAMRADTDIASEFISVGETIEWEIHPSVIRAFAIATLEGLGEQMEQESEKILNSVDENEETPINIPPGETEYGLFQIHVLTISYVEGAGEVLFRHHINIEDNWNASALIGWASHEDRAGENLGELDSREEQLWTVFDWATGNVKQLSLALLQAEVIRNNMYQAINETRDRRNNLVHRAHLMAVDDFKPFYGS
jgi:hypothetical protein